QPLQFLQRCGRSDPLLRPGLSAGGKPRLGCHCYAHQPLAAPARKLAVPTPAFDRLSRAAAIARPRRRAWFRRVSSARLRAPPDALCARTIEPPRGPLPPLASAAAPTSLVQASVISAFTRVFRRAMRAHYRVAALAARSARQRGRADEMIEQSRCLCRGA